MTVTGKAWLRDHRLRIPVLLAYAVLIGWLSLREQVPMPPGQWDKGAHFIAYGVFGMLGSSVAGSRSALQAIALAIVAYSGLLEIAQSFVPGREMSALDLLANACGVALGMAIAWQGIARSSACQRRRSAARMHGD